ncbi:MAG: hypothetical protein LZF60_80495 [Nitrospira sp.]|nr:MAG: hypothetical protein LZF60_80495 [Nitrospira sp.]
MVDACGIPFRILLPFDDLPPCTVAGGIEQAVHREAALREIIDVQSKDQDYSGALQTALLGRTMVLLQTMRSAALLHDKRH